MLGRSNDLASTSNYTRAAHTQGQGQALELRPMLTVFGSQREYNINGISKHTAWQFTTYTVAL